MNEIQIFNNPDFGTVRTLDDNGVILFAATDVAKILGYSNPYDAISRHCKGVVKHEGVSQTTNQHGVTTNQTVEMSFIPESDLYRLGQEWRVHRRVGAAYPAGADGKGSACGKQDPCRPGSPHFGADGAEQHHGPQGRVFR